MKYAKLLIILVVVLFVMALVSGFLDGLEFISGITFTMAFYMALVMMLAHGTFMDRPYYKVFYGLILLMVIGALFKILHLTGADQCLAVALVGTLLLYTYHFITKQTKRWLDILKVVMVVYVIVVKMVALYHVVSDPYDLQLSADIFFWLTFGAFLFDGMRQGTLYTQVPGKNLKQHHESTQE